MSEYGHDEAMADLEHMAEVDSFFTTMCVQRTRLAAYIKRLEAEHEAVGLLIDAWELGHGVTDAVNTLLAAHTKAERVRNDE